ncbi:MAG: hypothetical protein H6828_14065 [Planctomycetes bacterium]|nr:hypothetical protein [Planctomycetota bacterium]
MGRKDAGSVVRFGAALWGLLALGCSSDTKVLSVSQSESCMHCHNASSQDDYAGPGIENPHPFGAANELRCTTCHGGNPDGADQLTSHVPPPPEIGDRAFQDVNAFAWFNKLTLTGLDKLDDYQVDGVTYTALDYLQFVNPGDLRVVTQGRACGMCHQAHGQAVAGSPLATETGILAGATYAAGIENQVTASVGKDLDTAADLGFRAVTDPQHSGASDVGSVTQLLEFPVFSRRNESLPSSLFNNDAYLEGNLGTGQNPDGTLVTGSPLANLWHEMTAFTCGDCHLGSSGANNRYGDFRSSGCSACHMPYALSGRSGSRDANVNKAEPLDPDNIDDPERPHLRSHRIVSTARTDPDGTFVAGMDDHTCAGCHQGSNRTVMQYWGIRLDQNQDVRRGRQYPANPASYRDTTDDPRLFDPAVGNETFNGRNRHQYLVFEDYDGDGRDDTPADVHYEAGMGCIDCHGSVDLHGGDVTGASGDKIKSRMEQAVKVRCESCHGSAAAYAQTVAGTAFDGEAAQIAVDAEGNPLDHVELEGGNYWLTSRLDGVRHFVPQTRDTIVDTGKLHPVSGQPIYTARASFAMGRDDGTLATGIGPRQTGHAPAGFSHTDRMDCATCHSAWTNTCTGCHLQGEYNNGNNFSNITGERIVFRQRIADFVYQSPVPFQLGVNSQNEIAVLASNTDAFFSWRDRNGQESDFYVFSDRNGGGNNPAVPYPSMSHNSMMAHSIRGRVTSTDEGARNCVSCHLTTDGLATWGAEYDAFRAALAARDYGALDYDLLKDHFGKNPGNQLDSPLWVHAVAGLGSGLYLFDENGAAVNPLDHDANRKGAGGQAPADTWDPARARLDLDRVVEPSGRSNGGNKHPMGADAPQPSLRDGALFPGLAGPLGATLVGRLTDPNSGIVLNAWIDANGDPQGDAAGILTNP